MFTSFFCCNGMSINFISLILTQSTRGPRLHLKRLNAPSHWMLSKMGGIYAPRPSQGPHKIAECLPLTLIVRDRLHLARDAREAGMVIRNKNIVIDGKARTDEGYPAGFMDVLTVPK
jgi:small subunit ribosomal protein S4e